MVGALLRHNALQDFRDRHGCTALHVAAIIGHPEMINILCNNGADIKAKDDVENTALHYAVTSGEHLL